VDNTNSQAWEIAPYVALAKCWNCAIEIHRTEVDPVKAFERNVHHVPKKVIESMAQRFEKNLPNFWPKEHIVRTDEVETLPFHS
jgi:predicted kinase